VVSITGAPRAHSDDLDRRINRYLISMLIRTVCVVLVVVVDSPVRWVFAVGAVILPYVAVVLANARGDRRTPPPPVPPPPPRGAIAGTATSARAGQTLHQTVDPAPDSVAHYRSGDAGGSTGQ
jgi:hypothetical protein